jgi:hypothetical protein
MVAFTALLSKGISLGSKQVIRYDKTITNVGKAYTPSTGIFLVPLSGIYTLSVSMMGKSLQNKLTFQNALFLFMYDLEVQQKKC